MRDAIDSTFSTQLALSLVFPAQDGTGWAIAPPPVHARILAELKI